MLGNYGIYAKSFESSIKDRSGAKFCRLVSSCDLGLIITLKAFDLRPGTEILVPSFTFNSTGNAILWNNCIPRFVDIDIHDLNIDLDDLESKISKKTSAILGTNTFGNPCDLKGISKIAEKYDLPLIFDSAHAFGARYQGKPIAKYGDAHVFSFGGTKIVTSAEGGAIVTPHKEIDRKIQYLRNHGFMNDYNGKYIGLNAKISELNAALGYLNIENFDKVLEDRKGCYQRYYRSLKDLAYFTPHIDINDTPTYPYYTLMFIRPKDALKVALLLKKHDIETKQYYFPLHRMPIFSRFQHYSLPSTNFIYPRILNLPIHTDMDINSTDFVTYWVTRALHGRS